MSDPEPFYVPDPDGLGQHNAHAVFAKYAARLQDAGLAEADSR